MLLHEKKYDTFIFQTQESIMKGTTDAASIELVDIEPSDVGLDVERRRRKSSILHQDYASYYSTVDL